MGRKIAAVLVIIAMAAGSAFYLNSRGGAADSDDKSAEAPVRFSLDKPADAQSAPVEIDFDAIPDVIAEVAGEPVKKNLYVKALKGFKLNMEKSGHPMDKTTLDRIEKDIFNNIVNMAVLDRQAKTKGVIADAKEVENRLKIMRKSFPGADGFKKALEAQGISEEALVKEVKQSARIRALIGKNVIDKIKITDQELRDYYDLNQLEFEAPEKVHASHILALAKKDDPEEKKKSARERMEKVLEQLKDGADFAELAKKESDDKASGARGGDLGFLSKRQVVPEFAKVVFSMKPGELSGVVESRFGYHIIKAIEKSPAQMMPFDDEMKETIHKKLMNKRIGKNVRDYIKKLREQMGVKTFIKATS